MTATLTPERQQAPVDWFARFKVVDVDSHVTEPPDLWTSRLPAKYKGQAPHVERNEDGRDVWVANEGNYHSVAGSNACAGTGMPYPGPATYEQIHPSAWQNKARLEMMDKMGIYAQVLYPNVGGFGAANWAQGSNQDLALACVQAYNDFTAEFASIAPDRLLPQISLPFWDLEASLAEIRRCLDLGIHRGVNFSTKPSNFGQPYLWEPHWYPIWKLAEEAELPINFHIGSGNIGGHLPRNSTMSRVANVARLAATMSIDNLECISDVIHGGLCHHFPKLKFVSVESGAGYIPPALEFMDWQWKHLSVAKEHPEYDLMPSEYFQRQIYACFWFERKGVEQTLTMFQDNLLYETDFPHPAAQYPVPGTLAVEPREYVKSAMGKLPESVARKILCSNPAKLYKIKAPLS